MCAHFFFLAPAFPPAALTARGTIVALAGLLFFGIGILWPEAVSLKKVFPHFPQTQRSGCSAIKTPAGHYGHSYLSFFTLPFASTEKYSRRAFVLFLWVCLIFLGVVWTFFLRLRLPPSASTRALIMHSSTRPASTRWHSSSSWAVPKTIRSISYSQMASILDL